MSEDTARRRRLVILGDPEVGKTALLRRFSADEFPEEYRPTPGSVPWKGRVEVNGEELDIIIWDIGGRTLSLYPARMSESEGAMLVCDLSRPATVDSLPEWWAELHRKVGDVPALVVANKSDLTPWKYQPDEAKKLGFRVVTASAKTGQGVREAFSELFRMLARR